jgi:hypothetical protein
MDDGYIIKFKEIDCREGQDKYEDYAISSSSSSKKRTILVLPFICLFVCELCIKF